MAAESWRVHGNLVLPDGGIRRGTVTVEGSRIAAVVEEDAPGDEFAGRTLSGAFVGPGLIDLHMHGAEGSDFMSGEVGDAHRIADFAARHGVTAVVAALVTATDGLISTSLRAIRRAMDDQSGADVQGTALGGARLLGVHLEGPYLSQSRRGGQDPATIRAADISEFEGWTRLAPIRIITIAPEKEGSGDLIEYAVRNCPETVLSAGHTDATYEQVRAGIDAGIRHFTHFLCGMSGFHHRQPGVVGAGLVDSPATVELIADLVHVHPAALLLVAQIRGEDKVALVTDSVNFCGLPDGSYTKRGREYRVADGSARMLDGTLAGSLLTMNVAVRNMAATGVGVAPAWRMASKVPASVLGLGDRKGALKPGLDADITVLDDDFEPMYTMVGGQLVLDAATSVSNGRASGGGG